MLMSEYVLLGAYLASGIILFPSMINYLRRKRDIYFPELLLLIIIAFFPVVNTIVLIAAFVVEAYPRLINWIVIKKKT